MKNNLKTMLVILLTLTLLLPATPLAEEEPDFVEEYEVSAPELGEQELPMGEDCAIASAAVDNETMNPALDGEEDAEIMAAAFETEGEVIAKGNGLPVLNITAQTLAKGDKLTLKVVRMDDGSGIPKLTWSSNKKKVASVNKSGKVTAKGVGTATITVSTKDGRKATCTVTVKKKPTKVTLNKTKATLKEGDTLTLKASIPSGSYTSKYTWSSDRKSVATVDANGVVTAVKKGTATITVKTANGKKATCKVTVKAAASVTTGRIELSKYIGAKFAKVRSDLSISGYGDNNIMFWNTDYTGEADYVEGFYILHDPEGRYNLYGLHLGMSLADARSKLNNGGWVFTDSGEGSYVFDEWEDAPYVKYSLDSATSYAEITVFYNNSGTIIGLSN